MNTFNPIFKEIRKYVAINSDTINLIIPYLKKKKYPKNETLLSLGEYNNKIFFIVRGLVREFFISESGEDLTTQIVNEDSFFYSSISFHYEQPSSRIVEALEDCEVIFIEKKDFKALADKVPELLILNLQIMERVLISFEHRSELWKMKPASSRLKKFLLSYPLLAKRVSKKHLASFLNITPETFSRINFSGPDFFKKNI